MKIILASQNKGKIKEIKDILLEILNFNNNINIISLEELKEGESIDLELSEVGSTYCENAIKKAEIVWNRLKLDVLAEDSGLEIKALGNLPGLFSSRFLSSSSSYKEKCQKIIELMQNISDRRAKFVSVVAFISKEGKSYTFRGECEGNITYQITGFGGFGYDPIFIPIGYSKTFANMPQLIKNRISHRRKALDKFVEFLLLR